MDRKLPPSVHQKNLRGQIGNEVNFCRSDVKRYSDDICAIIRKCKVKNTLNSFNGLHANIEVAHEMEKEWQVPDLLKKKKQILYPETYKKPMDIKRVIFKTLDHTFQHKVAFFNHMISRVLPFQDSPRLNLFDQQTRTLKWSENWRNEVWTPYSLAATASSTLFCDSFRTQST